MLGLVETKQGCDKYPYNCWGNDKVAPSAGSLSAVVASPTLPRQARLPINRCNLPAVVLGSLLFQQHPAAIELDGVAELHRDLFRRLVGACAIRRPQIFNDYLVVHFRLERPEDMGFTGRRKSRIKANYRRMIRGWSFDSDSREAAVLKGWVESRFGLIARYHGEALRDPGSEAYQRYTEARFRGLAGTSAIESQLDLVYSYCQLELSRQYPDATHVRLYRGVNRMGDHEILGHAEDGAPIILLNNLSSFTSCRERAGEFGDYILAADIPLAKIFFHNHLLPGVLQGEDEFLVIGGVVQVSLSTY